MLKRTKIPLLTPVMVLLIAISSSSMLAGQPGRTDITLAINEFMASNSIIAQDPQGQYDDWIEIHNFGAQAIDTGGMYLTDNLSAPRKWRIPDNDPAATVIPPGGHLLIWADNDTTDAGLHANFKLDADGEDIGLFDSDGVTLIDSVTFGEQTSDISFGRNPDAGENWQLFASPSPGAENVGVYDGFVSDVEFSHERGFYRNEFSLTLATETEDAVIYYSLDGGDPYEAMPRGRLAGVVYSGPIPVSRTTCLRAVATKPGYKPSDISTQTYIFISDVTGQSRYGQAPGAGWPSGSVNGQTINYGMDPDVVNDPRYSRLMDDALLAIPSISLVTDLKNLFDSSTGIYVNARRLGRGWERPASVELINPDGSEGFQINAGLRIRGGYSRNDSNPKHAFRLFFRAEYGRPKLIFPLFEDEGVDEFDNVDLRTAQNYSWSYNGSSKNTMVREVFSRDVQRDMGQPYTRSRYYHLYLNGQYWGLFQTQERSEASYAESYFGGEKADYDVVKTTGGNPNYTIEATDGTLDAYRRLWQAATDGFAGDQAYYRVQGLNTDGTRNPAHERLLDVDNLIDYMLCTFYVGDCDGPISNFLGNNRPNNYYAIYNRAEPDGFKFFRHDGEHTIGAQGSWNMDRTGPYTHPNLSSFANFTPQWLHQQLVAHPEYRMRVADRAHKYFANGGLMTPEVSTARLLQRASQIETAIIAESARWGDSKRSSPFTKDDHWWPEINRIVNNYGSYGFPMRHQVVLGQLEARGWYPGVDACVFRINGIYQHGGEIRAGDMLSMNATGGTIWYTLDGSDPRPPETSDVATVILVPEDADKRVFVPVSFMGDTWRSETVFDDRMWLECTGAPGGVGYENSLPYGAPSYGPLITLDLEGQMYARNTTCYIRIPFVCESDDFSSMTLKARYDDGFVAYLNGVEAARRNFNGTPTWNSNARASHSDSAAVQFESIDVSGSLGLLARGQNLLAIHGLNTSTTSSDLLISVELTAEKGGLTGGGAVSPNVLQYTGPITLGHSAHVKARVLSGGTWSALNETIFAIGPIAENLRITEIMYNPTDPNEEFIELRNIGAETINLNLVGFADGIDFTFPALDLAAGEHVVAVRDENAFEAKYGAAVNVAGQYSGALNNAGERIILEDAIGRTVLDFTFEDCWRSLTDGEGFSLTVIDPADPDPNSWNEKSSWRPSAYMAGSPGHDDSGIIPDPGAVVINELLARAGDGTSDWVELYNTIGTAIDISGWFLSDRGANLFKYEIADGTIIAPSEYLVLYQDQHFGNATAGSHEPFALSSNGERLYLSSAQEGVLTGYRDVQDFGVSATGVSFGRYYKSSTDNYNFVAMDQNTPAFANSYPKVGPVVISEIMYNPDWPAGGSYTNEQYEYVELCNITTEPVTLYRYDETSSWKFTDGIEFEFDAEIPVTIPPGGFLLVVKNPAAFFHRYPTVPAEEILGPYSGSLSNAGEKLELAMPADQDTRGERVYIRIDRVNYSDGSHPQNVPGPADLWPGEADGQGKSLTRKTFADYGNDPDNWIASAPSPGR
ncbi:MAG: lamin tail domain-containing protein [Planctomycetota bacterium]|jgi:hypothetical protein